MYIIARLTCFDDRAVAISLVYKIPAFTEMTNICQYNTDASPMRHHLTNHRFFSSPPWPLKVVGIYIWGDALVVVPLWALFLTLLSQDATLGTLAITIYYAVRGLGEMIYWIHQQFGSRTYRPYDFGFSRLDTHAIYIIYQLLGLAQVVIALTAGAYILLH